MGLRLDREQPQRPLPPVELALDMGDHCHAGETHGWDGHHGTAPLELGGTALAAHLH